MTLTPAAQAWYDAGATPLPVATDGSKRPGVHTWKQWQTARPTPDELAQLHAIDHDGIGVLTGTISGNLTMLEVEGIAVAEGIVPKLAQTFTDHGHADLWQALIGGCSEITPSGGMHWYYRLGDGPAAGNTKLARRPATEAELAAAPGNRIRVLIETRGEGGFSVTAPSAGRTHPTGKPWLQVAGSPATIPTFTLAQQQIIFDLCELLDQMPTAPEPAQTPAGPTPPRSDDDIKPGEDYNRRARWEDILGPHGWTVDHRRGTEVHWIRPGKKRGEGISATTGHSDDGEDRLYVFTTSTEFEAEVPYTKFGAYALLEHGGDHSAAAKQLRADGWGSEPKERHLTLLPSDAGYQPPTQAPASPITNGSSALAPQPAAAPAIQIIERSEDALALALVNESVDRLRYVPQRSKWLVWDGSRWRWDDSKEHRELVRALARRLPVNDKTEAEFRRKMLSARGVSAVAQLAESDRRVVAHIDRLDAHPWQLNTPAGAINLRTGELLAPDPDSLHTRSTSVAPDFDMPSPVWDKFLVDTFGGDAELTAFVQRLLGLATIGEVLEQILPFSFGSGANGKTTLIDAIQDILGRGDDGYAISAQPEMLMHRRHTEHSAEIAQLTGARMVVCSELEDGARFAEARIKQLTGGDAINARFMRENPFTFTPTHTIFLIANHKPQATVGGPAFWRRLLLLPFAHVVPESERDPELPNKLSAEAPAILAWLARGASDYATGGLRVPGSVKAATADYQRQEDTIGRFVDEQCHVATGSNVVQVKTSEVRAAYERMCHELGDEPVSARRLTQELRGRWGVESTRSNGVRHYSGLALIEYAKEDEGDES